MTPEYLWSFLVTGYLTTVAIEAPVLLLGLAAPHRWPQRLFAGLWLTACTYPIVVLVLPLVITGQEYYWLYLTVAETFAPVAECLLFAFTFQRGVSLTTGQRIQDYVAITLANLASFGLGMWIFE